MFRKKAVISLLLALLLTLCPFTAAFAEDGGRSFDREETLASSLKAMGLFQGVSDTDFALDRAPTRAEALVMLLRLLGLEQTALRENRSHPFRDTAACAWADPYIGYAYANGLTKGQSTDAFGGSEPADARSYLTFVLRVLGYAEGTEGDFTWEKPFPLARKLNLLPVQVQTYHFLRADVASVSYAALNAHCKDGEVLSDALVRKGALTSAALKRYYDPGAVESGKFHDDIAENVAEFMRPYRVQGGIDVSGLTVRRYTGVTMIGDAAYEQYGFYAAGLERVAAQIRAGAEAVAGKANVYAITVPNRLGAVLSYEDFARFCSSQKNETEAIAYAYGKMGAGVRTVDAISELRIHNTEDIYFRNDHHWTALGAYYAYTAWAKAAGRSPVSLDGWTRLEMPGHLGMFYGMCGNPYAMKQNPDTVIAYQPGGNLTVEITESNGSTHAGELIYDYSKSSYKYGAFLGGDHPLTTITNNDIPDDSACVLVKDSYGNPFSVYLTQHYHTVYVIDYRYYRDVSNYLTFSRFAEEKSVDDFIVLLPMTLSQSDSTANYLARYCK